MKGRGWKETDSEHDWDGNDVALQVASLITQLPMTTLSFQIDNFKISLLCSDVGRSRMGL